METKKIHPLIWILKNLKHFLAQVIQFVFLEINHIKINLKEKKHLKLL